METESLRATRNPAVLKAAPVLVSLILLAGGCQAAKPSAAYTVKGIIRGISADRRMITIQHEEISKELWNRTRCPRPSWIGREKSSGSTAVSAGTPPIWPVTFERCLGRSRVESFEPLQAS